MDNEASTHVLQAKIDQLNEQAWDARVQDSPKSLVFSREAVQLARSIHYHAGLAHGLKSLGFCFVRIAKNNEALPLLEEALALFKSLGDLKGEAVVYEYLAIIQRNWGNFAAALELLFKALELSEQTFFKENVGTDHYHIGVTYKYLGNFEHALESLYKSLSIYRELNDRLLQSYPINVIGSIYFENGEYAQALEYYKEGLIRRQEFHDKLGEAGSLDNIGLTYFKLNDYSQAIAHCKRSLAISESTGDERGQANAMLHLAEIYRESGDKKQALDFCNRSLLTRKTIGDKRGQTEILLFLVSLHQTELNNDKTFAWLEEALRIAEEINGLDLLSKARFALYNYYQQQKKFQAAIAQLELHMQAERELHKNTVNQKMQHLEISHKAEEAKKEMEGVRLRNVELNELNAQISSQKEKLELALSDLKTTQAQLIQSEKMASLGELTAGIAHEIQNPLNFVNNFSDVNQELLTELKAEIDKGNFDEVKAIAADVISNEEKINHHGKRADAIVKGMLQHSRSNSGKKEPTDINALAEEYLRLAYHGLRAKDNSFNAILKTEFDDSLPPVIIIPQDIGRVILNLITNAFYAVAERKKSSRSDYHPTVTVSTKLLKSPSGGLGALITVADNGNGIPTTIMDKIFQPFFTTKPAGQGTGLGLSLSYDIVRAHGGQLKVDSTEQQGTTFLITLPAEST